MSHNLEYLLTRPGALKIATIVFGIVAAILSSHSYGDSPYTDFYEMEVKLRNNTNRLPGTEIELYNMVTTLLYLGISFLYLVAHALFYAICESRLNKFIDTTYHMAAALFLFAGGTTLLYSSVNIENNGCRLFQVWAAGPIPKLTSKWLAVVPIPITLGHRVVQGPEVKICHYFGEKIVAGSFNILNSLVYGFLGFVIFTTEVEEL